MTRFGVEVESIPQARDRVLISVKELRMQTDQIEKAAQMSGKIIFNDPEWIKALSKQEKLREQVVFQYINSSEGVNIRPLVRRVTVVLFDHKITLPDALGKKARIRSSLRRPGSHY